MLIVGGIFLLVIGIVMFCCPKVIYELTESWKNNSFAEPSNLYNINIRIGGGVCSIVGIAGIVTFFLLK